MGTISDNFTDQKQDDIQSSDKKLQLDDYGWVWHHSCDIITATCWNTHSGSVWLLIISTATQCDYSATTVVRLQQLQRRCSEGADQWEAREESDSRCQKSERRGGRSHTHTHTHPFIINLFINNLNQFRPDQYFNTWCSCSIWIFWIIDDWI